MALPIPNYPLTNAGELYVSGLNIVWLTATTISLSAGQARDSRNVGDIILSDDVTIDGAENGVNGLDSGALANDTLYAVWAIADSTAYNSSAGLLSTSFSEPVLPGGYDMARRVGSLLTSGAAAILDFTQVGEGRNREIWYATAVATDIAAGNAVAFAAVDSSDSVPSTAKEILFFAELTADAGATRTAAFRAGASSSAAGQAIISSPASTVTSVNVRVPCSGVAETDYLVSDAAAAIDISVQGYLDVLE